MNISAPIVVSDRNPTSKADLLATMSAWPVKRRGLTSFIENLSGIAVTSVLALFIALPPYIATCTPVLALDAVWLSEPGSGDWNAGANWSTSPSAPVNPGDRATFNTSTQTLLDLSGGVTVESITFQPGASVFAINTNGNGLAVQGAGIVNNSEETQTLTNNNKFPGAPGSTEFLNNSTAGNATITNQNGVGGSNTTKFLNTSSAGSATITNYGGLRVHAEAVGITEFLNTSSAARATIANNGGLSEFLNASSAGNAAITNNGGFFGGTGQTYFLNTSTAGNATITNNASGAAGTGGASTEFRDSSTASNATITNNGGDGGACFTAFHGSSTAGNATITTNGGSGSGLEGVGVACFTAFQDSSTAGNATITTNGGSGAGFGGETAFLGGSDGGTARAITNGNGSFDISGLTTVGMKIGSIEGSGDYFLGGKALTVGGNNLSTTVSFLRGHRWITHETGHQHANADGREYLYGRYDDQCRNPSAW